jgi:hypothetical protein
VRFRKKPLIIEATQFFYSKRPWPEGVIEEEQGQFYGKYMDVGIRTPEGFMSVRNGDWIITGVEGERYPCKPSVFEATYEAVKETTL